MKICCRKLIVILVSEQTVPNVQFLKWFFKNNHETVDVLFISTEKMEAKKKSHDIIEAISLSETHISEWKKVCVDENSLEDFESKANALLSEWTHSSFVVNITGGTKIMSLAAYAYFQDRENCEMFYQPLNRNLQRIFSDSGYMEFEISELLTLKEYMLAHGIDFKYDNFCVKDYEYNKNVYMNIIKDNREFISPLVAMQNNSYFRNVFKRRDSLNLEQISDDKFVTPDGNLLDKLAVCETVSKFGFDVHNLSKEDLRYITGGWFEEFVYQKTKEELGLPDENIALNIHIEKDSDKNELDVIYIKENRLHVIECKSFVEGKEGNKVLNDALYKLQAIMKSKFGLNAKSYLYTMSEVTANSALNRAKEFGIEVVDGKKLLEE